MLEMIEGWDNYSSPNDAALYGWIDIGSANLGAGRFSYSGYPSVSLSPYNSAGLASNGYIYLPSGELATRTIGFAWYWSGGSTRQGALISLYDGSTAQCALSYTGATSNFYLQQGNSDSTGPISGGMCSGTFGPGQWYFVELQVTIGSAGSATVKVNGNTILTASGLNLQQSSSAQFNIISLGGLYGAGGGPQYFDDLYVVNPSGAAPTSFLGEVQVICSKPVADSTHGNTGWSPNTGSTEYTQVNGTSPSTNTNYINATSAGATSTFSFDLPSFTGTILAAKTKASVKQSDAGSHLVAGVFEASGTNHVSSNSVATGSSYAGATSIFVTNPATSSAFISSDITGGEFGIQLVS